MTFEILVIFALICTNGLLAMSEMAIVSARKTKLKNLAEGGSKRAKLALRLAQNPSEFLSTVQVGISLVGVLAGAFGGATVAERIEPYLVGIPHIGHYSEGLSVTLVVLLVTYLSLVVGELVPKQLALRSSESIAMFVAPLLLLLSKVTYPIVVTLSYSTNALLRILVTGKAEEPAITEDEIKVIIRQANEAGSVHQTEKEMIYGVLRLGDLEAVDLMTPRHEVVTLHLNDPWPKNLQKIVEAGHTYYPVTEDGSNHIVGITSLKLLSKDLLNNKTPDLHHHLISPLYVPEKTSAIKLLERFKMAKSHIALVMDEHGAFEGVVSINDLLAGIVGEIPNLSEHDEDPLVVQREDGSYLVDGGISSDAVKELLKLRKLPNEDDTYTTLGGMIMSRLQKIPKSGDSFKFRGYKFEVVDMDRHRIDKVLISKYVPKEPKNQKKSKDT